MHTSSQASSSDKPVQAAPRLILIAWFQRKQRNDDIFHSRLLTSSKWPSRQLSNSPLVSLQRKSTRSSLWLPLLMPLHVDGGTDPKFEELTHSDSEMPAAFGMTHGEGQPRKPLLSSVCCYVWRRGDGEKVSPCHLSWDVRVTPLPWTLCLLMELPRSSAPLLGHREACSLASAICSEQGWQSESELSQMGWASRAF